MNFMTKSDPSSIKLILKKRMKGFFPASKVKNKKSILLGVCVKKFFKSLTD